MLFTRLPQLAQANEIGNNRADLMRKLEQHYFRTMGAIDISHGLSILNKHDGRIQITFPRSRQ